MCLSIILNNGYTATNDRVRNAYITGGINLTVLCNNNFILILSRRIEQHRIICFCFFYKIFTIRQRIVFAITVGISCIETIFISIKLQNSIVLIEPIAINTNCIIRCIEYGKLNTCKISVTLHTKLRISISLMHHLIPIVLITCDTATNNRFFNRLNIVITCGNYLTILKNLKRSRIICINLITRGRFSFFNSVSTIRQCIILTVLISISGRNTLFISDDCRNNLTGCINITANTDITC